MTRLVLDDRFDALVLDPDRLPHDLPQWSTPELSAARYDLGPDGLRLRVDAEQPAWHAYPMLLVDLFDLTDGGPLTPGHHPKTGDVRRVRVCAEEM